VAVEAAGFAPVTRKGIVLQADQTQTVNFAISVQQANQEVTVEAPVAQVDTSTSTMSEVVDRRRIIELPLNGRNAASLALITAGTVLAPARTRRPFAWTEPTTTTSTPTSTSRFRFPTRYRNSAFRPAIIRRGMAATPAAWSIS
jgi:hypothetical protein